MIVTLDELAVLVEGAAATIHGSGFSSVALESGASLGNLDAAAA